VRWTGNSYVDNNICQICYQPECADSVGGVRPSAGSHAARLIRSQREYRGYCEWAVHPDEARFILHRGYALINGRRAHVTFIHNEAYVTQLRVEGSDLAYVLEEKYLEPARDEVAA
jgi:hypothetical protein